MKTKILFFSILQLFIASIFAQVNNDRILIVKYDFSILRDTVDINSVRFTDIMTLDIKKKESRFYSSLKHLGLKQANDNMQISGNTVVATNVTPFGDKESECIVIETETRKYKVYDRISKTPHYYEDSLITPDWKLWPDTISILGEVCQKATALCKGRNIVAWFAKNIPLQQGPWLYSGLPGLIMKVEDTKNQFSFTCRELNSKSTSEPVFVEYENPVKISKELALKKKRLYIEDPIASSEMEWGISINYGNNKPRKKRPYNPLELQ